MASLRISPVFRARAPSKPTRTSVRTATDLVIQHRPGALQTPLSVLKKGPPTGGRSAVSGHTVTVFGCTGFLGRYLVSKLGKQGCQVIVPYRDEDEKRPLRVMGDLGQIVPMEWDARNMDQTRECLKHSDVVYNLVGRDWETRNYSYEDVNCKVAHSIAQAAAENNTPRLIHVSHLNASANSPSELYRTKWRGERAVRDAFKEATIVRPGLMFGPEDWLLNDMAQWPIKYKLNNSQTRMMPVHVMDVAEALNTMLSAPVTSTSSTFMLPGPEAYTYEEMLNLVEYFTLSKIKNYPTIPKSVAKMFASIVNRAIWWPTVNPDEIERKYIDDAGVDAFMARHDVSTRPSGWEENTGIKQHKGVDGEPVKGWNELNITPDLVELHAANYLRRFRSTNDFDAPIEIGHLKPTKRYHVVP